MSSSILDLIVNGSPKIPTLIHHPKGYYGENDPGGLLEVIFEREFGNKIPKDTKKILEESCENDQTKILPTFLFFCMLSIQDSVEQNLLKTLSNEKDRKFLTKYYRPYCQKILDSMFTRSIDHENVRLTFIHFVSSMQFIWGTRNKTIIRKFNKEYAERMSTISDLAVQIQNEKQQRKSSDQKRRQQQQSFEKQRRYTGSSNPEAQKL